MLSCNYLRTCFLCGEELLVCFCTWGEIFAVEQKTNKKKVVKKTREIIVLRKMTLICLRYFFFIIIIYSALY